MHEKKYADEISRNINYMGSDLEEVGRILAWDHPTLQQNFMRVIIGFISEESKKDYSDARNEKTVELCRKLKSIIDDEPVYLPFI